MAGQPSRRAMPWKRSSAGPYAPLSLISIKSLVPVRSVIRSIAINNAAWISLPLDRRRRLAGDVVNHAVDASDLVDDAVADGRQDLVGQAGPVGGHEVLGLDGAEGDDRVV